MATENVTCASCGQPTSFERPDDFAGASLPWDCPNQDCGKQNAVHFPENAARIEADRVSEAAVNTAPGDEEVVSVRDTDAGAGSQQSG